ncbi:hypothetical protein O6H91_08G084500 [Diphasiastrum complanatum]|uniref:Uncharacterized protein n=1 Tax=Diphasiastrum complanatum TaxID=34168 RepID=A0ACC2CZD4_DIPCM|nr:hypothetical protein O6H91_08G084500 [Diphasiastrum complanatum]
MTFFMASGECFFHRLQTTLALPPSSLWTSSAVHRQLGSLQRIIGHPLLCSYGCFWTFYSRQRVLFGLSLAYHRAFLVATYHWLLRAFFHMSKFHWLVPLLGLLASIRVFSLAICAKPLHLHIIHFFVL